MSSLLKIIATQSSPMDPIPTELGARTPVLNGIKAVIFDIYGTLFISGSGDISLAEKQDRETAMRSVLEAEGVTVPTSAELSLGELFHALITESHQVSREAGADFPEVEIREIWQALLESIGAQDVGSDVIKRIAVRFETLVNPIWPMPHLQFVLARLEAAPVELGIVSNAQFYTPLLFEHFLEKSVADLGFHEDLCVWSFEERLGKPSPSLFTKLCRELATRDLSPAEAIYVGNDMRNDIVTANAAGMRTALFAGDQRSLRLREYAAEELPCDLILTDLRQLLPCLKL